ncbi:hypothetical protein BJX99DRAFT_269206 [Aspergillus californicus]
MQAVILSSAKQRRRPAVSCALCRKRKVRCNRGRPCSNCLRSRTGVDCIYDDPVPLHSQHPSGQNNTLSSPSLDCGQDESHSGRLSSTSPSAVPSNASRSLQTGQSWTGVVTPASSQSSREASLKLRIRQLEDQLGKVPQLASEPGIETTSSDLTGTFHLHYKSGASGQHGPIVSSVSAKTRLFGQSHWVVSGVQLIRDILNTSFLAGENTKAAIKIERCKYLARRIKAGREPSHLQPISQLPSRAVADALVKNYLCDSESIYRILHIPTFSRKYEMIWAPGAEADPVFSIQLKLVLAIGAVTYDDKFSLRVSAIHWINEAQVWMAGPKYKARLNVQSMQNSLLLLSAQERVGYGGDMPWVSAGALLRKAIYMGLHRDPSRLSKATAFTREMHRRLWNTILEINLQSSLTSGGAPLFSLSDFDTAAPDNIDDEQLDNQNSVPKAAGEWTQMSIAIALRETFPQRLAVVKFLNDLSSTGTYEETMILDAELRRAFKMLTQTLRSCAYPGVIHPSSGYSNKAVDFLIHRYISALHVPYFSPALHGTAYAFSRRSVVESSLNLWKLATDSSNDDSLARLAALLIAVELRAQVEEDTSLCPAPLRPDLLCVLEDAKAWSLKMIEAGETSVKGYLLLSLVAAKVHGLIHRLDEAEFAKLFAQAVDNVGETCLPMLEQMAGAQGQLTGSDEPPDDASEDWTSDDLFNLDMEHMDWIFNDQINDLYGS